MAFPTVHLVLKRKFCAGHFPYQLFKELSHSSLWSVVIGLLFRLKNDQSYFTLSARVLESYHRSQWVTDWQEAREQYAWSSSPGGDCSGESHLSLGFWFSDQILSFTISCLINYFYNVKRSLKKSWLCFLSIFSGHIFYSSVYMHQSLQAFY